MYQHQISWKKRKADWEDDCFLTGKDTVGDQIGRCEDKQKLRPHFWVGSAKRSPTRCESEQREQLSTCKSYNRLWETYEDLCSLSLSWRRFISFCLTKTVDSFWYSSWQLLISVVTNKPLHLLTQTAFCMYFNFYFGKVTTGVQLKLCATLIDPFDTWWCKRQ